MLGPLLMMGASADGGIKTLNIETTDGFNRTDASPVDGSWAHSATPRLNISSKRVLHDTTTSNGWMRHTVQTSAGSQFVQADGVKFGAMLALRVTGTTSPLTTGYTAGRYYFSGSSWDWRIFRDGTSVMDADQVPFVNPATGCQLRLEVEEIGGNAEVSLYVDGTLAGSYVDSSPLTDTQYAGVYSDGRGISEAPEFDNFQAGSISYEAPISVAPALFTDDFNRSDRDIDTDADWDRVTQFDGTSDIVSNQLEIAPRRTAGGLSNQLAVYADPSTLIGNDHYAEIEVIDADDIDASVNHRVGVVVRYSSLSAFYLGSYVGGTTNEWQLINRNGGFSDLAVLGEARPSFPFKMRLRVSGTSLALDVDDGNGWVEKLTATDSTHTTGLPGVWSFGLDSEASVSTFDNFKAGNI